MEDIQRKEPECPYADAEDMLEQMFFADELPKCYEKTDEEVDASFDRLMEELKQDGFPKEKQSKERERSLGKRYWLETGIWILLAAMLLILLGSMGRNLSLIQELRQYLFAG